MSNSAAIERMLLSGVLVAVAQRREQLFGVSRHGDAPLAAMMWGNAPDAGLDADNNLADQRHAVKEYIHIVHYV